MNNPSLIMKAVVEVLKSQLVHFCEYHQNMWGLMEGPNDCWLSYFLGDDYIRISCHHNSERDRHHYGTSLKITIRCNDDCSMILLYSYGYQDFYSDISLADRDWDINLAKAIVDHFLSSYNRQKISAKIFVRYHVDQ